MTPLVRDRAVGWSGSCSTEYVRGREAVMPQLCVFCGIANCNQNCILPLGEVKNGG